jgi:hypothetical protein
LKNISRKGHRRAQREKKKEKIFASSLRTLRLCEKLFFLKEISRKGRRGRKGKRKRKKSLRLLCELCAFARNYFF